MNRRTFLKILGFAPMIAAAPRIAATEELIPAHFKGTEFYFKPENQNTGATININDLGRKPIVNQEYEVITISGASNPEYNGEFKSVGFKVSVDKSESDGANIVGKINFIDEPFPCEWKGFGDRYGS